MDKLLSIQDCDDAQKRVDYNSYEKAVYRQLADTMRENEQLKQWRDLALAIGKREEDRIEDQQHKHSVNTEWICECLVPHEHMCCSTCINRPVGNYPI